VNLGEEVTKGYAAHSGPPDLTVTTRSLVDPHFLVDAIKPMVSASVDATRTGYTGRPSRGERVPAPRGLADLRKQVDRSQGNPWSGATFDKITGKGQIGHRGSGSPGRG